MKKVVVIGAGIAGLSAAIYAQRSGFDVTICEQHSMAGGMCTSWKRKGYFFEGAVHWLTGSDPKTECYQLWKETGALNDTVKVFMHDVFYAVEWEGRTVNLYRSIEKTAQEFLALSPTDAPMIRRLVKDVRAFSGMHMPIFDVKNVKTDYPRRMNFGTILKMLPAFPLMGKLSNTSNKDYAEQFSHPAIRQLLRYLGDEYSAVSLIATLASLDTGDGGYPEGGSLAMVGRMRKTFEELGGKLLLSTKVKKVNIENNAVSGVTLESGIIDADAVIVSQETIAALDSLFGKPLSDKWLTDLRINTKSAVCTFIGIGIKAKITQTPIPLWELDEPIVHGGITVSALSFNNYADYEYSPPGCTTLTTALMGDTYEFWKKAKEEGRYNEEKQRLADQISRAVCKKFPQAEGNIEVIDIATPVTYERYTGAHHGSWMSISGVGEKMKMYPGYLKNVKGLYFAGHRLMPPGGLPVAVDSGRRAAQMVCRQFKVLFKSRP